MIEVVIDGVMVRIEKIQEGARIRVIAGGAACDLCVSPREFRALIAVLRAIDAGHKEYRS